MVTVESDKCIREGCNNKAQIHPQFGAMPCASCQAADRQIRIERSPEFANLSKQDRIQQQRDKYEKDLLPPRIGKDHKPNPDFVKAYPEFRDTYFSKDELAEI